MLMINVLDFGDNLQLAMDTASQQRQPLYFPAGEWNVDAPLHIPDRGLRMCGESLINLQQSVIYYHGATGSLLRGVASEMPYGIFWGGIEIKGLAFSQRGNSPDPLVYMQGLIFSSWERCRFLTRGHQSPGLMLDYHCTLNQFLHCDFEPENGAWGLIVQGGPGTSPTINRFSNCEFMSNESGNGALLHATNTNYFESCSWENLQTGIRVEPHPDPLANSLYNVFIAPRLENCTVPFDWSTTSDRNFVLGRYMTMCGPDQGNYRFVVEWGSKNHVPQMEINGYTPGADKLRIWGDSNGGIGLFQDMELTDRLLSIFTAQGKPRLKSKYGMVIESEAPGSAVSKLTVDMPITLAERTDATAPAGTLYFSTTQSALAYKDGGGVVHVLY